MTYELKNLLATLANDLGVQVRYEYSLCVDSNENDSWPSLREQHTLVATGYELMKYVTLDQVLAAKHDNFIVRKQ